MTKQECLDKMVVPGARLLGEYGLLTVISGVIELNKWGKKCFRCVCKCGVEKLVELANLKTGAVKTCGGKGCKVSLKHGGHGTKLYTIWSGIKARCDNPTNKDYPRYGGRGIGYDPRWKDFAIFASDVGQPPVDNLTIDRRDNERGYWPDNVRWATDIEQANNRRSSVVLEYEGRKMTVAQWAREIGINNTTLHERLKRGVPIAEALTVEKHKHTSVSPRKHI